ncbi:C40 family peptidase [Pelobium sp.]|nr:NlpC/P60 family protein [Pelobium sp.]MDA9555118.1 C40 family peptidase [Pelobium sp.]
MIFKLNKQAALLLLVTLIIVSCDSIHNKSNVIAAKQSIFDTIQIAKDEVEDTLKTTIIPDSTPSSTIDTTTLKTTVPATNPNAVALVSFAKTLLKTPYLYGGKDPKTGFDNIGFVTYVFSHFNIQVPNTIQGFSSVGETVNNIDASAGDLILFSKSDSIKTSVSYIGIITTEKGQPIEFIYANAGKIKQVTISPLNSYYQKRMMAIRRLIK